MPRREKDSDRRCHLEPRGMEPQVGLMPPHGDNPVKHLFNDRLELMQSCTTQCREVDLRSTPRGLAL